MDLIRLSSTDFYPVTENALIEGYSSLIWTERYKVPGEFQLKTKKVAEHLALLPDMTLLTLRDTKEVMFVESRTISVNEDGHPELTVIGKSLPEFLKYRTVGVAHGAYDKKYAMIYSYSADKAAALLLWNAFVNTTTYDVTWQSGGAWGQPTTSTVPNLVVSNSVLVPGTSEVRWITAGPVYQLVLDLLNLDDLGVRCIRPESYMANVVNIQVTPTRGVYSATNDPICTELRLDIYKGTDRSVNQDLVDKLVFSAEDGHFDNTEYLWSIQDYLTRIDVRMEPNPGGSGFTSVTRDGTSGLSGLDLRTGMFNAGAPDPDESTYNFLSSFTVLGENKLEEANKVRLLNFDVSPDNPYKYNEHYYLGDRITVKALYDFEQTMRVDEYVRTEDAEGERGYPGLSIIE